MKICLLCELLRFEYGRYCLFIRIILQCYLGFKYWFILIIGSPDILRFHCVKISEGIWLTDCLCAGNSHLKMLGYKLYYKKVCHILSNYCLSKEYFLLSCKLMCSQIFLRVLIVVCHFVQSFDAADWEPGL